ncbi:hypothetical protein IAT38_001694 [Cryptococcus sp. DSM 104549]
MKIFLTGATGYVGKHTTPLLLAAGHQLTALARSDSSAKALEAQGITAVRGTLEDTDVLHNAAKEADGVIHLAFVHDINDFGGNGGKTEHNAIHALASALEGTNKPLLVSSAIPIAPIDDIAETDAAVFAPRAEAESIALSYVSKGVRTIIVRLSPTVHGEDDHMFIAGLVVMARKRGFAAYGGDGENKWPAVHVKDAAELYKLAVESEGEKVPGGTRLHAAAEVVPFKQIAEAIGKRLGVEVKGVPKEKLGEYVDPWITVFALKNTDPKTQLTRELTGWVPKEKGLLEDLETSKSYFQENQWCLING